MLSLWLSSLLIERAIRVLFFFFNDTATTEIYTFSLHDALPISSVAAEFVRRIRPGGSGIRSELGPRPGASSGMSPDGCGETMICAPLLSLSEGSTTPTRRAKEHPWGFFSPPLGGTERREHGDGLQHRRGLRQVEA